MAGLFGVSLAFVISLHWGRFTESILLAALIAICGLRWVNFRQVALYAFVSTLALAAMVSTFSVWTVIVPAAGIYLLRVALGSRYREPFHSAWLIVCPAAALSLGLVDRDLTAGTLALMAILAPIPRLPRSSLPSDSKILLGMELACFLLCIIAVPAWYLSQRATMPSKITAILEVGQWASSRIPFSLDRPITIASSYSYSELASLLNASIVSIESLNKEVKEAWLLTPTAPMSDRQRVNVLNWVRGGGLLFVVTDHTDLYGHARVVNELLELTSLHTSLSAFFPRERHQKAAVSMGRNVYLKTANIQGGVFVWPRVSARWIDERVDYSARNFFGPRRPSWDDLYGRHTIAGIRAFGSGSIVLFGDSTVLANFAIYQPGTIELIEKLRHLSVFHMLLPFIYGYLLIAMLLAWFGKRVSLLGLAPLVGIWAILDFGVCQVKWPEYQWWAGEKSFVMEWQNPKESLSTAFALAPLSGKRPRWSDDPNAHMRGIWVGKTAPPSDQWRWLQVEKSTTAPLPYDRRLDGLLLSLNSGNPRPWPDQLDYRHIKVGDLWTNSAMGDWWFDQGISKAKRLRIDAWLSWLKKEKPPSLPIGISVDSSRLERYLFRVNGRAPQELMLPKLDALVGDEVYIGRGVSADAVAYEEDVVLVGTKSYVEGWDAPATWTLTQHDPALKAR